MFYSLHFCIVVKSDDSRRDGSNTLCMLAVFAVAEFYMEYQVVYTLPSCDYQLINLKQQQLHEFICQKSVEKCPFHTTTSCHHLTANVGTRRGRHSILETRIVKNTGEWELQPGPGEPIRNCLL